MSSVVDKVRILVEKLALHKGKRGLVCRVFAPGSGSRAYTVVLEYSGVREQIFLEPAMVAQFDRSGVDQQIQNLIRTAIHKLERMEKKHENRRDRA